MPILFHRFLWPGGLGHSNLKTTSDYLEEQLGYTNAYARDLEDEFGI